ncbi:MAG: hypothetical protein GWP08_02035 [Nitrospiraceae bacterium]|nr:hypothetical protein [Nitrospiraceae bacterium]
MLSTQAQETGWATARTWDEVRSAEEAGTDAWLASLTENLSRVQAAKDRWRVRPDQWRYRFGGTDEDWSFPATDDGWTLNTPEKDWQGDEAVVWWRVEVEVPASIHNLQVQGEPLGLYFHFKENMRVYVNGEDRGRSNRWDNRYFRLTESAVPGERFVVSCCVEGEGGPGRVEWAELRLPGMERFGEDFERHLNALCVTSENLKLLSDAQRTPPVRRLYRAACDQAREAMDAASVAGAQALLARARGALAGLRDERGSGIPVIIKGPYLQDVRREAITVMWETDIPCDSHVWFAPGDATSLQEAGDAQSVTVHEVRLGPLVPETTYRYAVGSGGVRSPWHTLKAAPGKGAPDYTLVVAGDPAGPPAIFEGLCGLMAECKPDLILNTGDIGGTYREATEKYFMPMRRLMTTIPSYVAIGDHEYYGDPEEDRVIQWFEALCAHPAKDSGSEYYFAFTFGQDRYIILDAMRDGFGELPLESEQYKWLVKELTGVAATEARYRFMFCHRPPYSENWEGSYYDGEPDLREHLVPLLEAHNVTMIFSGNTHEYERGRWPRDTGPVYVITGGASGILDHTFKKDWPQIEVTHSDFHFCDVDVTDDAITVRGIDRNGAVFDTFTVENRRE